ncbi:MAG: HAMP domain-containing protein, partial [Treponemataceae bacterium]
MKGESSILPPPLKKSSNFRGDSKKVKKRFSLRAKLILVFGLLILLASLVEGFLAIRTARKAVTEKVEKHLTDKAVDTASIIDGRINAFFQFLEGIARMPILSDPNASFASKMVQLKIEAAFNDQILELNIVDMKGNRHASDGTVFSVSDRDWFKNASQGKNFFSEPLQSRLHAGKLIAVFAVPIYNDKRQVVNILAANVDGLWLSDQIDDIVVGETGYCHVIGKSGTIIAHKSPDWVTKFFNGITEAKNNVAFASYGSFIESAVMSENPSVGFYQYKQFEYIAAFAKVGSTGRVVIINAPVDEFMGTVNVLRITMIIIGIIIILTTFLIVYFVATAVVKPIKTTVAALKDIAQGEGDLTVRLPVKGNDEITDLSNYFNQT